MEDEEDARIKDCSRRDDGNYYLIRGEARVTLNRLSIYESAKLVAVRTQQIDNGGPYFTDLTMPDGTMLDKASHIAAKELNEGQCPLLLRRPIGSVSPAGQQYYEEWDPNSMDRDVINIQLIPE